MTFYTGTYGIPFTIVTKTDLTGATPTILVRKPDGSTTAAWSVNNVMDSTGYIIHTLAVADFNIPGQYVIHWYAITPSGGKIYGNEATFSVETPVI